MASAAATASSKCILYSVNITILIILLLPNTQVSACFKSIISFGDSIADTGNLLHLSPPSNPPPNFASPPYGETYFHLPTGRFSDGRLIIDFIAEELALPFTPPFHSGGNVSGGVNFAVGGATALPDPFFAKTGVQIPMANVSLLNQFNLFKEVFLPTLCHKLPAADCEKYLESSLVLVGEIGGNDYNDAFLQGKSVDVVRLFIPRVVKEIIFTINELIKLGAVTLMVAGNFPIGCSAAYLTYFQSSNEKDYDPETGFTEGALRACCGAGGPYNVNLKVQCGGSGSHTCKDPSSYVSWDGVHLTEAAYRSIATSLLRGSFTVPQLQSVCNSLSSINTGANAIFDN
ncbi:hypothetical protein MIMGU_mgv1a009376mg [Erythranthe guttata]|uniref:SGNH hydrolase-type esterase domain-containing protein n=1 Tax=Erythranthe guttata TaxID=4155 RepID=A0A022QJF1_ERYGU|nr:hypothetical protein MIMGU_mgv1a009376mg [Erythranthe guttata]